MAKNRLYRILSRLVEINPGEEVIAVLLFFYFFLITAPFWIVKPLRDAIYLHVLTYKKLPLAYLLTAVLIGFVVAFHSKLQVRIQRHTLIIFSLIFFMATSFFFWLLIPLNWRWMPLVFWVWANILIVVLVTQFWITVNDIFNPREAKRLIGFFGSGGILGGFVGGETAGLLAKSKLSNHLLLITCALFMACILVVNYIFLWQKKKQAVSSEPQKRTKVDLEDRSKIGFRVCFNSVKNNYYLKLLAAIVGVTWIVSTLVDLQFKGVINLNIVGRDNLTIIKKYGIRFTLLLYPFILLICSLGIAAWPILIFAILIKGSDKSLSYSLNQSVRELLYIPVSPELKYKAKIFIDMFVNRFAKGIGAIILIVLLATNLGISLVSAVTAFFILIWIILNLKVSKEYINTVKQKLEMKWDRADKMLAEKLDMDYTKLIFDTLESKNRSSVLYAMHLFDLIKQDKLTPEIRKLISYKSDEIRASSMGTLLETEETTIIPETDDYWEEKVLEKEVKEIMNLDVYHQVMKNYMEKILSEQGQEGETAKMEVAKAIGLMEPDSALSDVLEELIQEESPQVSRYTIESIARLKRKEYIPALINKLKNPITREDASSALEKFGPKIVGTLADFLADEDQDIGVRQGAASVLARLGTQEAADLLCWELKEGSRLIKRDIIDALNRIRAEKQGVEFSPGIIKPALGSMVKEFCQKFVELYDSKSRKKKKEEKEAQTRFLSECLLDIFKLLEIIYPREDIIRAFQNVRSGAKESVAYAVELLDNILEKEMKEIVLPLIENLPREERLRRCRSLLEHFPQL